MRNTLTDLNNHLFEQLERLSDLDGEEMQSEKLEQEIQRAKTISTISEKIISNAAIVLKAQELQAEYGRREVDMPKFLGGSDES